jgi:hypothetical protein
MFKWSLWSIIILTSCTQSQKSFHDEFYKLHQECSDKIDIVKEMTTPLDKLNISKAWRWDLANHLYSHLVLICMEKKINVH